MMNYTIKKDEWQKLADVMGEDYDASKNYAIHVNEICRGFLKVEYTTTVPTSLSAGREIPQFSVLDCKTGKGDSIYLTGSCASVNICVFEVE